MIINEYSKILSPYIIYIEKTMLAMRSITASIIINNLGILSFIIKFNLSYTKITKIENNNYYNVKLDIVHST